MKQKDVRFLDFTMIFFAMAMGGALVFAESLPIISGIGVAAILFVALLGLIDRDAPVETEDVETKASVLLLPTREELAALAHERWAGWIRYMLGKGRFNQDDTWTMPAWALERWTRQMNTPYHLLSGEERDSDRQEADQILAILQGAREE